MKASAIHPDVGWASSAQSNADFALLMCWASSAQADVNASPSMSAMQWASSAQSDVNLFSSMSAMKLWHDVPAISDVNSSLRCLVADVLLAADVNFSLRCLLSNGHCLWPMLALDVRSACHRVWDETMPWNFRSEGGVVVIQSL